MTFCSERKLAILTRMLVRRQRDGEEAASPGKQRVLGAHFGTGAARLPRPFKLGSLVLGL